MFEGPEKKFQKHIFEYLVREHKYAVLEQYRNMRYQQAADRGR
jgi:hypothetical protein